MKTENNPDYDRKKLEARKKMARTQQEMKDKMNETKKNIQMIGKEKVLPAIDRIPCFVKKFGNSVNMSMKRMEEKTIENIMRKTENYEMYEIDEQNIVLTNDEFAKENNPLALYVRKYRTYTVIPNSIMIDLFYFLQSDKDILAFVDIVEQETGISKSGKMLMIVIMSYIYHCCDIDEYTIWSISSYARKYNDFDQIFENVQIKNPNSFVTKMLKNFQLQNDDEKKKACMEVVDFFTFADLHYEDFEVASRWLFESSHMFVRYIYESDDENKIIMVCTKDEKYGKIIYQFLKHILCDEQFIVDTGSNRIKDRECLFHRIVEYKYKVKNDEYIFRDDPLFATTEDPMEEYKYYDGADET